MTSSLADQRRIMALITFADTEDEANRFIDALSEPARENADRVPLDPGERPVLDELRTEKVMLPRVDYLERRADAGVMVEGAADECCR